MARATTSLPVPDSPRTSTLDSCGATWVDQGQYGPNGCGVARGSGYSCMAFELDDIPPHFARNHFYSIYCLLLVELFFHVQRVKKVTQRTSLCK